MRLPQWLAEFNRYFTNPVQRLWAGFVPAMGIIEHVGRKSGKQFRTPVNVFPTEDGLAILLTYGPNRDWVKNLNSANGGQIKRYGRTVTYKNPRIVPKAQAAQSVKGRWRPLFSLLPFEPALLLTRA
ncbi:MAG: nitroreductase family deazaflavin-dependent oxidoreductase [Mycobacteriaceae bacterium]|nr:nitroreductase family deazaflavin-dependent oxidoreductase [Mycobacteriaceae bacterium]